MSDQKNILNIKCRQEFRHWLAENSSVETECWIHAERGKPTDDDHLWYLEELFCLNIFNPLIYAYIKNKTQVS